MKRPVEARCIDLKRRNATPSQISRFRVRAVAVRASGTRPAFSLVELIVVISVALLLTSLLMPALRHVHENAHRIICMSHLQQMGQAFTMYAMKYNDRLPYSAVLQVDAWPQDLVTARRVGAEGENGWDGLGLLYALDFCPAPECFYCPSHHGDHPYERYADLWEYPAKAARIFTNYHYAGDVDWVNRNKRRNIDDGLQLVLATDGLRTLQDFNHKTGLNLLRADGSVKWRDNAEDIVADLPLDDVQIPDEDYNKLWSKLTGR